MRAVARIHRAGLCGLFVLVTLLGSISVARAEVSLYVDSWMGDEFDAEGNITLYAHGEGTSGDATPFTLKLYIRDPNLDTMAFGQVGGYDLQSLDLDVPINVETMIDGDYKAKVEADQAGEHYGCASSTQGLENFTAVFTHSHFNAFTQKHVYIKDSSYCNGLCQPSQLCSTSNAAYAWILGLKINAGFATYCKPAGPRMFGNTRPPCKQKFGAYLGGFDDEC